MVAGGGATTKATFLNSRKAEAPRFQLTRVLRLIPGFAWNNPVSFIWGAVLLGVFATIVGWYIAWMHNVSLMDRR